MVRHQLQVFYRKYLCIAIFAFFVPSISSLAQIKIEINSIAKQHFKSEQIQSFTAAEIHAINFMFTSSFIVDKSSAGYIKWLNDHNGIFDISLLNRFRKQSERAFYKTEHYPGFVIELFSWDEIQREFKNFNIHTDNSDK